MIALDVKLQEKIMMTKIIKIQKSKIKVIIMK